MILVVGRPGLDEAGDLARLCGRVALAAVEAGTEVELVGSVGDDDAGDKVVIALGRAGIGHAAVLRDPAGVTPREHLGETPPRLDARDLELAFAYLPECRVLVLAEPLDPDALRVASAAAAYHGAAVIAIVDAGEQPSDLLPGATVLSAPQIDDGAFAALVGRYAAGLAQDLSPAYAWQAAVASVGWEEAPQ